jgi:hypothetical protein
VIEIGRQPAGGGVTGGAVLTELAFVFIILLMAGIAIGWCALEDVVDMAILASHVDMLTIQLEGRQIVVEGGREPAVGGMARATIRTVTANVIIILLMTGIAIGGCALEDIVDMATRAGHIAMLTCQFESKQIVVHGRKWGIGTAMVGVAISAAQVGIVLAEGTVQCDRVLPLGSHVGVTIHAPVGHCGAAPEGGVTQVALASNFCMGTHTTQLGPFLGIECTGAEQHAARGESESCHDEDGQNGSHETRSIKTTQTRFIHSSSTAVRLHNTTPRRCG